MSSAEEQQFDINELTNTILNKIEKQLLLQRSVLSSLDEEKEQMFQKVMSALHSLRDCNTEVERVQLEGVKLVAKRNQQKKQLEDITKSLEAARATNIELKLLLEQEELEIDVYEKPLQELANKFRQSAEFYNEKKMEKEVEMLNQNILELQNEEKILTKEVAELTQKLHNLHNDVPENILEIVGQKELDEKLQLLSSQ